MEKERKDNLYELLRRGLERVEGGEELPAEWARELFPPERREAELVYKGKETEEQILADTMAVPLQRVSVFGNSGKKWDNKLIFGDNLQAMKRLLQMKEQGELLNEDGTPGVRLIYIDPPFATRKEFRGSQDQKAYQDKIYGAEFLEFLRKRLVLLKELLADDGSIYVHLDWKKAHYTKVLMDEVFGENFFQREVIWWFDNVSGFKSLANNWIRDHESIFWYTKSNNYIFNKVYGEYPEGYESKFSNIDKDGRRFMRRGGRKQYLDELKGKPLGDVWRIPFINNMSSERIGYPTQKPETLLERIVRASSNSGDLVLDAFAGSGTTCAVSEKLGRRWIAIDCGKLSIYSMQKRMLNLKQEIGDSGKLLKSKPFSLYNAGLYDFETLRRMDWGDWRSIALQLFECKDEPHKVRGFQMDGKRKGSSVYVFNHFKEGAISRETVKDIHASIGKYVGDRCFIIAPRGAFLFQEDYIEMDGVRYYALRIPYSYISELHRREFSALRQPSDEDDVNEAIDAVGFDFIQPPLVEYTANRKGDAVTISIEKFESRARLRDEEIVRDQSTLSMVMVDLNYNGRVFDLDEVHYASSLKENGWKFSFEMEKDPDEAMLVFLDIYGNEARIVLKGGDLKRKSRGKGSKKRVK